MRRVQASKQPTRVTMFLADRHLQSVAKHSLPMDGMNPTDESESCEGGTPMRHCGGATTERPATSCASCASTAACNTWSERHGAAVSRQGKQDDNFRAASRSGRGAGRVVRAEEGKRLPSRKSRGQDGRAHLRRAILD